MNASTSSNNQATMTEPLDTDDFFDADDKDDTDTPLPKQKITITSPSPDVAIATIETIETIETANLEGESSEIADSQTANVESVITEATEKSADSLGVANHSEVGKGVEDEDDTHDSAANTNVPATKDVADDLATKTDDNEVIKQKETQLESYKQFIAKQFSDQKVNYPEVRVAIEANALPSRMFFVMNVLSAIIASYGLITNSAAVVIGAMLVAMMLGPITGIALATIDYRLPLLRKSLLTLIAGVSLVVMVGFVVGSLHNGQPLTAEILSRTQPTSMDLMIALAGGTAGAYAMVSPHLSVAVVGVAVATALVPPLAASGILLSHGEMYLGLGALILAITNIIAIQFTNALVLWVLGFRRLVKDDYKSNTFLTFMRRNAVSLSLLIGLGIYLSINLKTNARQQKFENNVNETINSYFEDKGNVLTNTQFDKTDDHQVVRAVIRGETTPSSYDVQQIEATITQDMQDNFPSYLPIKVQLRYLPVQVIEANPLIQEQLDQTDVVILTN